MPVHCSNCSTPMVRDELGRMECPDCGAVEFAGGDEGGASPPPAAPETGAPSGFPELQDWRVGASVPGFGGPETAPAPGVAASSFDAPFDPSSPPSPEPPDQGRQADPFGEILQFANSSEAVGSTGGLVYHVHLEGIDSAEVKQELFEAFSDRRFGLEPRKLLASVRAGKLSLLGLNPVKASILLQRLKHLPLGVRWTAEQLIRKTEASP